MRVITTIPRFIGGTLRKPGDAPFPYEGDPGRLPRGLVVVDGDAEKDPPRRGRPKKEASAPKAEPEPEPAPDDLV